MTVFDIIWIAVIILWILRSVSRASGGGAGSAGGTEELPSGPREEQAAGRADWRERLMEAAREWELEQRRRAGEPVDVTPTGRQESEPARLEFPSTAEPTRRQPAGRARVQLPQGYQPSERTGAPPARRRSSVVVRDMTPDRKGGMLVEAPPSEPPVRRAERIERPEERKEAVPEVTATPIESRARKPAVLPSALTVLERQSPLRRAILYREIFGPPKALSEIDER